MLAPLRQVLLFQMYLSSFLVVETTFTNGTDVPNHFGEHVGSRTLSSGPLAMARHLQGCSCQDGCTVLGLVDSRCFFYMYSLPLWYWGKNHRCPFIYCMLTDHHPLPLSLPDPPSENYAICDCGVVRFTDTISTEVLYSMSCVLSYTVKGTEISWQNDKS